MARAATNIRFHRRVMFTVLSEYIDEAQAREEALAWAEVYQEQALRGLDRFLHQIRERHVITLAFDDLRSKVYSLMFVNADRLLPDPLGEQVTDTPKVTPSVKAPPGRKPAVTRADDSTGHAPAWPAPNRVFVTMVDSLARACEALNARLWHRLSEQVLGEAAGSPALRALARDLARWLDEGAPVLAGHEPETMQQLLHRFYVALCEHYGPEHTDRLMHEAVVQARAEPAATRFNPRRLL